MDGAMIEEVGASKHDHARVVVAGQAGHSRCRICDRGDDQQVAARGVPDWAQPPNPYGGVAGSGILNCVQCAKAPGIIDDSY